MNQDSECVLSSESQLADKLQFYSCPKGKNYTFNKNEVWNIHRENQRLHRVLSAAKSTLGSVVGRKSQPVKKFPTHSAVNRKRQQKRIEKENEDSKKRLESVKSTLKP